MTPIDELNNRIAQVWAIQIGPVKIYNAALEANIKRKKINTPSYSDVSNLIVFNVRVMTKHEKD